MECSKPKKIIIAIDGFSSCGKSTFAKTIAAKLGYIFIDTGAMYRAVTLYALEHGAIVSGIVDEEKVIALLDDISIDFRFNPERGASDIYVNGDRAEGRIRTIEVSNCVSRVSSIRQVREKLVAMQQAMGRQRGVVMDGRDIGTGGIPQCRNENLHDGRSRSQGPAPLRRTAGQRRLRIARGDPGQHRRTRQGRHDTRDLAAAPGRRRRSAGQQPHDRRRANDLVHGAFR